VRHEEEESKIADAVLAKQRHLQANAMWLAADGTPTAEYTELMSLLGDDGMTPHDLSQFYSERHAEEEVRHKVLSDERTVNEEEEAKKISDAVAAKQRHLEASEAQASRFAVWLGQDGTPTAKYTSLIDTLKSSNMTPLDLSEFYGRRVAEEEVRGKVIKGDHVNHSEEDAKIADAVLAKKRHLQ